MAQLPPKYPHVMKRIRSGLSWRCSWAVVVKTRMRTICLDSFSKRASCRQIPSGLNQCYVGGVNNSRNRNGAGQIVRFVGGKRFVQCSSSSASSSSSSSWAEEVKCAAEKLEQQLDGKYGNEKEKFGYLVRENGWQIRRMDETEDEMREVANIQAEAFHEPVFLFNDLFFGFFQAEVLSGLLYRLRNSTPDRYACLVAEPFGGTPRLKQGLVGVVDVTVYRDDDVLKHLPGADEYLYVSGIAVLNKFRRQKVATALLKACDVLMQLWRFEYLVLRAYEDDWGAQKLYSNAGYRIVSGDPPWVTWIGRRRRVLMIKRSDHLG